MSDIASLLSGGLVGGFIGAFLGGFAKFLWEHWLPSRLTWQREQRVKREKLLSQFRDPAIRAISELQSRLFAILLNVAECGNYGYLKRHGHEEYYILSTSFLVAQFCAWVEILRREGAMLDYSELITRLERATQSLSHGIEGFQIFKLEQREIGERMLSVSESPGPLCMGYAQFVDLLRGDNVPACLAELRARVLHLMEHPIAEMIRLVRIQHAMIDLIEFIDPDSRWVPQGRRARFDVLRQLRKMQDRNEIGAEEYAALLEQARGAGILTGNAA
jgi:hypothetical protein